MPKARLPGGLPTKDEVENLDYNKLRTSLRELETDVDYFITTPDLSTLLIALDSTSYAFSALWSAYLPDRKVHPNTTDYFLNQTSRLQEQTETVCSVKGNSDSKRIRARKEDYMQRVNWRRDVVARIQEGEDIDKLKRIMASVVPEAA